MTDEKTPVDQALDLFLFAPLGLALDARQLMPKFVERGRNQVAAARMIGQFAVTQGQIEAAKQLAKLEEQMQATLENLGIVQPSPSATPPASSRPATPKPPSQVQAQLRQQAAADAESALSTSKGNRSGTAAAKLAAAPDDGQSDPAPAPSAVELAIPDYDSLAASQVIPRLGGLAAAELEAVRLYEATKRGRKTILSRIAQLQSR